MMFELYHKWVLKGPQVFNENWVSVNLAQNLHRGTSSDSEQKSQWAQKNPMTGFRDIGHSSSGLAY